MVSLIRITIIDTELAKLKVEQMRSEMSKINSDQRLKIAFEGAQGTKNQAGYFSIVP